MLKSARTLTCQPRRRVNSSSASRALTTPTTRRGRTSRNADRRDAGDRALAHQNATRARCERTPRDVCGGALGQAPCASTSSNGWRTLSTRIPKIIARWLAKNPTPKCANVCANTRKRNGAHTGTTPCDRPNNQRGEEAEPEEQASDFCGSGKIRAIYNSLFWTEGFRERWLESKLYLARRYCSKLLWKHSVTQTSRQSRQFPRFRFIERGIVRVKCLRPLWGDGSRAYW